MLVVGARRSGWPRAKARDRSGLVRLRCRQDEKPLAEVHLRWPLAVQLPYAGAARLVVHPGQPTLVNLPLSKSVPQPVKSPHRSPHTSGTHSGKAAYGGDDRPKSSPFIGRRSPASTGEMGASDDDGTHRGGTSCRWLREPDRLVVSVGWCILKSVWGRNLATNSERYQVA